MPRHTLLGVRWVALISAIAETSGRAPPRDRRSRRPCGPAGATMVRSVPQFAFSGVIEGSLPDARCRLLPLTCRVVPPPFRHRDPFCLVGGLPFMSLASRDPRDDTPCEEREDRGHDHDDRRVPIRPIPAHRRPGGACDDRLGSCSSPSLRGRCLPGRSSNPVPVRPPAQTRLRIVVCAPRPFRYSDGSRPRVG
jgi:hypothetical protein